MLSLLAQYFVTTVHDKDLHCGACCSRLTIKLCALFPTYRGHLYCKVLGLRARQTQSSHDSSIPLVPKFRVDSVRPTKDCCLRSCFVSISPLQSSLLPLGLIKSHISIPASSSTHLNARYNRSTSTERPIN